MTNYSWQVSNLELSREMKELGIKQKSVWWWAKNHLGNFHLCYNSKDCFVEVSNTVVAWHSEEVYSALTCAELGEILKEDGDICYEGKNKCCHNRYWHEDEKYHCEWANTEANARAKMVIYLKKKGEL